MYPMKLFADLQVNPRNLTAYRKLAEHYRSLGMTNEAEAFSELIRKKFDADDPHSDEERRQDPAQNA